MSVSFEPKEVGLTIKGEELAGDGYVRQPYAYTVTFGPAQPEGWGTVDGVFVTDGRRTYDAALEPVSVLRGTILTLDVAVTLV